MTQGMYTVTENTLLADSIYKMVLEGDTSAISAPGQFVNLVVPGRYLRRPISICDWDDHTITLIYKVVGHGTEDMANMPVGTEVDVLNGLGNGYDTTTSGDRPVLIGGGVGTPPLYALCKKLVAEGKHPTVILGFNTASEIFWEREFEALVPGCVSVTTVDGTYGTKGFVTEVLKDLDYTYIYTCGPAPMFRAIHDTAKTEGQYSLEERMGCGFGACMGCSIETANGPKRVCKEGPVFKGEEILW